MTSQEKSPRAKARRPVLTVWARLVLVAVVAIAALFTLVAVNASQDWQQQRNLRNDSATGRLGGEASLPMYVSFQEERKRTAVFLAQPTRASKAALLKQRQITDAGIASFRHLSGSRLETDQRHRWSYVERIYKQVDRIKSVRRAVDDQAGAADAATDYYTGVVNQMIEFYQALSAMDDGQLTLETRPLVGLFYASDALAQQDMLIAQARASGSLTPARRIAFASAYGSQSVMYERWISPYLPPKDKTTYGRLTSSAAWTTLQRGQRSVLNAPGQPQDGSVQTLPAALDEWDAAYGQVAPQIAALNLSRTQGLLAHGFQRANEIRDQVIWQLALSSVAVVLIALLIIWVIRSIRTGLVNLRVRTEEGAYRIQELVGRIRRGEKFDPQQDFPVPTPRDEFGFVHMALVHSQQIAAEQAGAQAADRRGFDHFVSVTTARTLSRVHRALGALEDLMKRFEDNTELTKLLIALDGMIVAVRRHQENLQGLTDQGLSAPYSTPKPLVDLVSDMAVETGSPRRIHNEVTSEFVVAPRYVLPVLRVLAALADNGVEFSNEDHPVTVRTSGAVNGVAVEIEDRGSGMTDEELRTANAALNELASFETMAEGHGRLGLFVVGRYKRHHRLRVELKPNVYGGVTAVVLLGNQIRHLPQRTTSTVPSLRSTAGGEESQLPVRSPTGPGTGRPRVLPARPAGSATYTPGKRAHTSRYDARLPDQSDDTAPALPRRDAGAHVAPQLVAPDARQQAPTDKNETNPEQAFSDWSAIGEGLQAAETRIAYDQSTKGTDQ